MRRTILTILLTGSLVIAAGCAGDESSSVCDNLEELQASVGALREIEPNEGAVDELRAAADEIESDLAATQDAAEEELAPELDAFDASLAALRADFDAAEADGFSRASLTALLSSVSSAAAAFEALIESAPDCDL